MRELQSGPCGPHAFRVVTLSRPRLNLRSGSRMESFARTLFRVLREMDAEAVPNAQAVSTGLNWYGGHYEPQKQRPRSEVCWSLRLAELLPAHGHPTRAEVPYPRLGRCKCDD